MINENNALRLLKKYHVSNKRILHSIGVAKTAYNIACTIHLKHPELPINPAKVKIAALLHDIGRSMTGDHEANTIVILKDEGLGEIASITMHGSYYEIMQLRGIDDTSLIPQTIENKIVAYSDTIFNDKPVTMQQRWEEIEKRRSGESEKIESLQRAKKRFLNIELELKALMK